MPAAHVDEPDVAHSRRWLIFGLVAAGAWIYVVRRPSSVVSPAFWAEDGTIFFKGAIETGWRAIFEPFAGQLLLFQRGIAFLAAPLPVLIQPAIYSVSAIVAAVASSAILLSPRWRLPVPLVARFICVIALLSSPQVDDVFATLSNAHWWLAIGLISLGMLSDPPRRAGRAGELAFTAIASLSGFAAIYGLPMLGVRAIRNRSRHSWAIVGIATVGVLVQVTFLVGSSRHGDIGPIVEDAGRAVLVLIKRVFATDVLGASNLEALVPLKTMDPPTWAVSILLAGTIGFLWIRAARDPATRLEAAALGITFIAGWMLALWALTLPGLNLEMAFWPAAAPRYFVVPTAAIYLLLLLWKPGGRGSFIALGVAVALLASGLLGGYRLNPRPAVDWAPFATCVDETSQHCSIVIPPDWALEVDARDR